MTCIRRSPIVTHWLMARRAWRSTRSWRRQSGEHVIKKHRYSGFFGTDLDIILREWGVDTIIISGTTTENCCQATARDAMFRNYRVVFLSDATATYDYPDRGFGAMPAADVHHATLVILAASTAHVMSVEDMRTRISSREKTKAAAIG
jgi:biuret amidohydrolase